VPDLEIAGLVDVLPDAAAKRAAESGLKGVATGTSLAAVLETVRPDVVFDCTIPSAHVQVTMTALAHGCHVLGEKPLADTLENARKMIHAATEAKKLFAVIQNRRYDPAIRRMKRFLSSGVIGRIGTVHCDFMIGAHFGGFRDRMDHVLLLDMAIHTIDAGRFLIGVDPAGVIAKEWNPVGSWFDHDASAFAAYDMANGCVFTYRGSWCAEGLNTSWEGAWRFMGERGTVTWDGGDGIKAQVVAESGGFQSKWKEVEPPPPSADDKRDGHVGLIREFIHCVRTGEVPETICTDNVKSLAMVLAAIESAETNQKVAVNW
jgi:predicted dehydrogenase